MIQIRYEGYINRDCPSTVQESFSFIAFGNTPEEVHAFANQEIKRLHLINVISVGCHNYREDWEAVHGKSDYPDTSFLSRERTLVKTNWFKRLLGLE